MPHFGKFIILLRNNDFVLAHFKEKQILIKDIGIQSLLWSKRHIFYELQETERILENKER